MASPAEARIRIKAEAFMRERWPDARIVHEFDVCGARIDIAAITPDRLILGEVKSERDVLDRLPKQARRALRIGGPLIVFCAPRWIGKVDLPWRAVELFEFEDTFAHYLGGQPYPLPERRWGAGSDTWSSRGLLDLLLKPELLALARPFGGKTRHGVPDLANMAHEGMTGGDIRRAVMQALRARRFGWAADDPIAPP